MAYNTGNSLGSTDPRDLSDNSQNFDQAVNDTVNATWTDRFGNTRVTLANQLGYNFKGDYAAGIELVSYSDIIRYSGEFYRPSASATLPYTTTATLPDADSNLIAVGDAVLRQDLAKDVSTGNGAALVNGATIYVGSVAELEALTPVVGQSARLTDENRAGDFVFRSGDQSAKVSSDPQQGIWVAPISDSTGASGAWMRRYDGLTGTGAVSVKWFGATGDGVTDDIVPTQASINYVYNSGIGAQVHFPAGTYIVTEPIRTAAGIALVGHDSITRLGTLATSIKKTTTTESSVLSERSGTSTSVGDGFDGIDHYPNTIIHATSDLVSDGNAQSFSMKGIHLDGDGVCDYGVYARYQGNSYYGYNRVTGCKTGFVFWSFVFITEFSFNSVEECERGFYIDSCTSLDYSGNYVRDFTDYGHKVTRGLYSSFTNNAADLAADGFTDIWATSYFFRNCVGCMVSDNGSERVNGTFLHVEQSNGSEFVNNVCLDYTLSYTGPDQINAVTLVTPFSDFKRNTVVFATPVNKAANHYNVHVSSESSSVAYGWDDSNAFVNSTGGATDVYSSLEQGFGQSRHPNYARRMGVNLLGQDTTYYVDKATGDDTNDGTSGSPVATIQKVIDSLPRPLHVEVTINVAAEAYGEDLRVNNLEGTGKLVIAGAGSGTTTLNGTHIFKGNQVPVDLSGFRITSAGDIQLHISYNDTDGAVHDCDYDTAATGTLNQFVRGEGRSRVGVYDNVYTYTTGANGITATEQSLIVIDSVTNSALSCGFTSAGRVALAGKETAL